MESPPPAPRAATLSFHESSREVALIDETARKRDFRELKVGLVHEQFGALDALY